MNRKLLSASLALTIASLVQVATAETPGDTYKAKCAMCHGADGAGNTPAGKAMKARDFHDAEVVKASDSDLVQAITKGKNKMPAYGAQYSQDQIKGLVAYIREMQK
jgi:mono/diheme cytochrome c family protein